MEKKKTIQISALATGTLMLGAFSAQPANAVTAAYEDLGSGAELRSELLANNNPVKFMNNREIELKCGEGSCGEKSKEKKADKKAKAATEPETSEDKAGEHKCGEGSCGEKATQEERDAAREKAVKSEAKKAKAEERKRTEATPE